MLDMIVATWPEARDYIKQHPIAVMATGALEQHGPHLPLATDTVMASALARRIAERVGALLLPAMPFGDAWNNSGFAGTISLSPETVAAIAADIGRSLQDGGVRALVVVNGHFGNRAPLELAARQLLAERQFPVLVLDYPGLEQLAQAICDSKPAAPSFYHADEFETSVMLALMPGAVHMARAAAEYPNFPATYGAEPIPLHTFCKTGVFGDPTPATAIKGGRLMDGLTEASLRIVEAFLGKMQDQTK